MFCRGWLTSLISVSSTICITSAWLLLAEVTIMEGIMWEINLLCPTVSLDSKHIGSATISSCLGHPLHSLMFWCVEKNVESSLELELGPASLLWWDDGESHDGEVSTFLTSSLCMGVKCGRSPKWLFVGLLILLHHPLEQVFSFISCLWARMLQDVYSRGIQFKPSW